MVASAAQPVSGWKIAATSKAGQAHIGVTEPLAGRLFKNFILADGARLPAAPLHMKVMEAEFAFRMARDLAAALRCLRASRSLRRGGGAAPRDRGARCAVRALC